MVDENVKLSLVAARDPTDVFNDLAALRRESKLTVKRKTVLTNVTVDKPANNVYFRTSTNPDYILEDATIIKHKEGSRETYYFVVPAMRAYPKLAQRLRPVTIRLVSTWPGGNVQLWPVPVQTTMAAWRSAQEAARRAETTWVQMVWNEERGDYDVEQAERMDDVKPTWPTESFPQLLKVGFASNIIDSEDHEYVRRLRGLVE
jgi:hypothetical protein